MNYTKLLRELRKMDKQLSSSRFWGIWLLGFLIASACFASQIAPLIG